MMGFNGELERMNGELEATEIKKVGKRENTCHFIIASV